MARNMTSRRGERGRLGPFILKYGSRLFLGVTIVLAFLTIVQCSIEKPESPTWTTSLTVPVVNRTYDMQDIIERIDQDEIIMDHDGTIAYSIAEELDTVSLSDDNLSVSDMSYGLSRELGPIEVAGPSLAPVTMLFTEVPGLTAALAGGSLPAMGFNVTSTMPVIDNFSTATISQGSAVCVFTNDLGVDFDVVTISLYDIGLTPAVLVTSGTFPGTIPAGGGVDSLTLALAGKTLSNELEFRTYCHTPGGAVTDVGSRYIETELVFPGNLLVSSATAMIPEMDPMPFYASTSLDLASGESIDNAALEGGTLALTITNNTNLQARLQVAIPELTLGGTAYYVDTTIDGGETVILNSSLAGYVLSPTGDVINVNSAATVPGSGATLVTVDESDSFDVDATLSSLVFSSVTGVFASSGASFDGIHEDLDVPDGFGEITLNSATLSLEIDNAVDQPGTVDITLTGSNGKALQVTGDIAAAGASPYTTSTITNSDVADFLSPLPDAIDVSGEIGFGDGSYQGTISGDDWVAARVSIYAPLDLRIDSAEINDIDLQVEEIDQEDIGAIIDHVISASFNYTMNSHLPLGVSAVMTLSGDSASLYLDDLSTSIEPILQLDPIEIDPAPVSLATGTGVVTESLISSGSISLDNDDLQILKNDTLYIRNRLILTSSDSSGVQLMADDYVTITGSFEIEYRFDGEF